MYVDKRLDGIQAVQTLSRLNRTHPLKEETFVLDFVNDPDEIREAFKRYFEGSKMGEEVEPERLYEVKADLDGSGIYRQEEVEAFCRVFWAPRERQSPSDHKQMNAILDHATTRINSSSTNSPKRLSKSKASGKPPRQIPSASSNWYSERHWNRYSSSAWTSMRICSPDL